MNDLRIIHGDALAVLRGLESESVNCCITSPPYWGLRDYKVDGQLGLEKTYQEYLDKLMAIFEEVRRVLRNDGTCWVNIGDTYGGTKVGNTETIKNPNVVTSDFVKSGGVSKSLIGIPERFAIAMTDAGWVRRNTLIWWKRNCMPSSARDRFTVDFEPVYFFVKSGKYWFERQFEPHMTSGNGGFSNKATSKWSKADLSSMVDAKVNPQGRNTRCVWDIPTAPFKDAHFATFPEKLVAPMIKAGCPKYVCEKCGKAREKIYQSKPILRNNNPIVRERNRGGRTDGFTKMPNEVLGAEQEFLGYTDCGCSAPFRPGVVCDPFAGAGTVGVVAKKLNRDFIGIELNPDYIQMAESRIAAVKVQGKPFKEGV